MGKTRARPRRRGRDVFLGVCDWMTCGRSGSLRDEGTEEWVREKRAPVGEIERAEIGMHERNGWSEKFGKGVVREDLLFELDTDSGFSTGNLSTTYYPPYSRSPSQKHVSMTSGS